MSGYQMTDFFSEVLCVIAHPFKCLGHHENVDAGTGKIFAGFEMAHKDEVAQAVNLRI